MKIYIRNVFVALACLMGAHQAAAQLPVISSFSQNGVLVCTNLQPGSVASVQWASSLSGPWNTNWSGLDAVTVDSNGSISVSVPMFYRVLGVPSGPMVIASNLNGPVNMTLDASNVYFTDSTTGNGIIKSVPKTGGSVSTLLTGLSTPDGYIPTFTVVGGTIYGGYGGYAGENIFSAPSTGGSATTIVSTSGGNFFGVANSLVYYGSGFNAINSITTTGASPTPLAGGVWVREVAVDSSGIYFVDYYTKNVLQYSFSSGMLVTLIGGNSTEGDNIFTDANNVYLSISGNIESVPKSGGVPTMLVSGGAAHGYASDGANVFYEESNAIKSVPITGGTPTTLNSIQAGGFSGMVVDDHYIYWADISGGAGAGMIWRMTKP